MLLLPCFGEIKIYNTPCLKNDTDVARYNFDVGQLFLYNFGRNVAESKSPFDSLHRQQHLCQKIRNRLLYIEVLADHISVLLDTRCTLYEWYRNDKTTQK